MTKTYAIGDIHGKYALLERALERIESSPSGGRVVFLGDYVDRGENSRAVIERLMAGPTKPGWEWICLKGNHEDMMVGALRAKYQGNWWVGNGGGSTLVSYDGEVPEEHVVWADTRPLYHADGKRVFVHAGVDESLPMNQQDEETLLWSRCPTHQDCSHPEGFVVHGHTIVTDGPVVLAGRMNLDTGAFHTGRLSVAVFDDDKEGGPVDIFSVTSSSAPCLDAA